MEPQDVVLCSSHEEKNAVIAEWLVEAQRTPWTAEELRAEREWLLAQEPSADNNRHAGIAGVRDRYLELAAIPADARTPAEELELRDLEPTAVLAGYPRYLELKAIPAKEGRQRTRDENRELRAVAAPLKRIYGPGAAGIDTRRRITTSSPRTHTRTSQRPRERRAVSRSRARAPSGSDDGPEPPPAPRLLTGRERRYLKQLVSDLRREWVKSRRECNDCGLDLPREAFRPSRRVCVACEQWARIQRRRQVAA